MMNIDELREKALTAVQAARFESALPLGVIDDPATVRNFIHRRREEIVAAARGALNDNANVLPPEVILRLLFGKVSEEELSGLVS